MSYLRDHRQPEIDDRTPVLVVTGVDDDAMTATSLWLQLDLPSAVVVTHRLDVEGGRLTRVVADVTGVLERESIDVAHACTAFALREDVIPTIARLSALGRWGAVVAVLPVAADAVQLCRVAGYDPGQLPNARIAAVVCGLDGRTLRHDLLSDDWLRESDRHAYPEDERAVAEAVVRLAEYADVVCVHDGDGAELELVRELARPDAQVISDWTSYDGHALAPGVFDLDQTETWVAPVRRAPLAAPRSAEVWSLELVSERPLHPDRLQDNIERLGAGTHRARGCFWLPTRPRAVCTWDGAGGQLCLGTEGSWRLGEERITRIVVHGLVPEPGEPDPRPDLRAAFAECVLSDVEVASRGLVWPAASDGFEPWLGDIEQSA